MKHSIYSLAAIFFISGCSSVNGGWFGAESTNSAQVAAPVQVRDVNVRSYQSSDLVGSAAASSAGETTTDEADVFAPLDAQRRVEDSAERYRSAALTKHIGTYVQGLTQDLIANMQYLSDKTPVGVTHFSLLDSDLQQTNMLGFQLAESFMHELHKFRIPVVDYKATDYIRVTDAGDFFLSRDFLELENKLPLEFILTGTLTRHQGGYLVNARIIGLESKAVVSTAQMLVPHYVVDALLPEEQSMMKDGVKLIQG